MRRSSPPSNGTSGTALTERDGSASWRPFLPVLWLWLGGLALAGLDRLALAWVFGDGGLQWGLLAVGLRLDALVLAQLTLLPTLLLLLLPPRWAAWLVAPLLGLAAALLLLGELASWPFLAEFGSRPGALFVRYLEHPREVLATLGPAYLAYTLLGVGLVLAVGAWSAWRSHRALRALPTPPLGRRLALGLVLLPALALAARSGLGEATPTPGLAVFSDHRLSNELALNPTYAILFAAYRHGAKDLDLRHYGHLPAATVIAEVRAAMGLPPTAFGDPDIPTLHRQAARVRPARPRNLVIILEEGLGADLVGRLGGRGLTPELDRLAEAGLWFERLYAIGTRTTWGLQGVVMGFPPSGPDSPVMKLPLAQSGFFTVAELLRRAGYRTFFLYGGEAHFDDMAPFLLANGVERIIDRRDIPEPRYEGRWGVSDEDLFAAAHRLFQAQDGPFAAIVLTLSHHRPYDIPPGRVEAPGLTPQQRAARYADWALGRFFRQAREAAYFRHTVFVVTADHQERVVNDGAFPLARFRIPGLIIAPGLAPARVTRVASQMDLLPTALPWLGLDLEHPMIGRDHLADDPRPGRALLQFGRSFAYLHGERLALLRPGQAARLFRVTADDVLQRLPESDPAFLRQALAHVLFPQLVYHERAYRLP